MNEQIADLLVRYARAISANSARAAELTEGYNALRLADAALDKQVLNREHPDHALQVVVVGPTQAGKSTLCNLLLDTSVAGISALAGFTLHAQGFAANVNAAELKILERLMLPLTRLPLQALNPDQLSHFALEPVQPGPNALVNNCVVWDTPDFDSVESYGYRGSVLQALAMADVMILAVSKDKYADKTVWDMLKLIGRLGKPLFVCINKLDDQDSETVINSFEQRHLEQFSKKAPVIIALPFDRGNASIAIDRTIDIDAATRAELQHRLQHTHARIDRTGQNNHIDAFIQHHWQNWIAPIERERNAHINWKDAVERAVEDAKKRYATRYLNNPEKYETFNKAIAELLTLLEIPGLADALTKTRSVVTWPVRKLFGMGRKLTRSDNKPGDLELDTLDLILEQTLTNLQGHILVEQREPEADKVYWESVQEALVEKKSFIRERYSERAVQVQTEFEPQIEAAAHHLYEQLQAQPALLNTLRAARVSTDAAAVVLAVKSGGLAVADLVIAPAMLSVTTLLTESALGQYMQRSKNQLKVKQQALIDEQLFENELGAHLQAISNDLDAAKLLYAGYGPVPALSLNKSLS